MAGLRGGCRGGCRWGMPLGVAEQPNVGRERWVDGYQEDGRGRRRCCVVENCCLGLLRDFA